MDFIDVSGMSSNYRFRLWPRSGGHPAIAGNYVVVRGSKPEQAVVSIGAATDLSRLGSKVAALRSDEALYTRLGISRVEREEVHRDLLAANPKAQSESPTNER